MKPELTSIVRQTFLQMSIMFFIILVSSFLVKSVAQQTKMNGVKVCIKLDLFLLEKREMVVDHDSVYFLTYKGNEIVIAPYVRDSSMINFDKEGNYVDQKYLGWEIRESYFIYKAGEKRGLRFNGYNYATQSYFNVDSFLKNKLTVSESLFFNTNDSLVESVFDSKSGILQEKYIPKIKFDDTYNDTSIYYYSKSLNDLDYSFSRNLDSIKEMKLFKARLLFNPIPKGRYDFPVPAREYYFEMSRSDYPDKQKMASFIDSLIAKKLL